MTLDLHNEEALNARHDPSPFVFFTYYLRSSYVLKWALRPDSGDFIWLLSPHSGREADPVANLIATVAFTSSAG